MSRYLVTGSVIVNDMRYPDGSEVKGFLGGSIYTVNGILPYTDDVLFLSAAGPDFDSIFGDYFRKNGLSEEGIDLCFPKTHYTVLEYSESGEWVEHSIYGEEFEKLYGPYPLAKAEYVIRHGGEDVKGIYFESGATEEVWNGLPEMRKACPNAVFMAEIATSETKDPVLKEKVLELIDKIDIYSLNRPEAMALFGTNNEEESIEAIIKLGKPCFFRLGKKGSAMIQDGKTVFKVWAPTASAVTLNLFEDGGEGEAYEKLAMTKGEQGVWSAEAPCGHGTYYTYTVETAVGTQEAVDPYAKAVGVNGNRGMVIDLQSTDPEGFRESAYYDQIDTYSDAVIWEVHVRDFSNKIASSRYPGKYLAFTETGLTNESGVPVGMD